MNKPDWLRLGARVVGQTRRGIVVVGTIKAISQSREHVTIEDSQDEREYTLPAAVVRPTFPHEWLWQFRYDTEIVEEYGNPGWPAVLVTRWEENGLGEHRNRDSRLYRLTDSGTTVGTSQDVE